VENSRYLRKIQGFPEKLKIPWETQTISGELKIFKENSRKFKIS
jgi:hypothetical protein